MTSARSHEIDPEAPSADEVREQLDRVLSSELVRLPERARKFLHFVVEETLAGRSQYLKAYTIADVVFERRNFDAQNDPAVRIEAGRIRRELERYYLMTGLSEQIVITIPKGGYIPAFERSRAADADAAEGVTAPAEIQPRSVTALRTNHMLSDAPRWLIAGAASCIILGALYFLSLTLLSWPTSDGDGRPTIVIEAFEYVGEDADLQKVSQGTMNEVVAKLVMFKEIVVVDGTAQAQDAVGPYTETRYALQGTLRKQDDRIRSDVRLVRRVDGAVIWANSYDADLRVQKPFEAASAVAAEIAASVARPFGVMFESVSSRANSWDAYDCALSYYAYRRKMTLEALLTAQDCLSGLTRKHPTDATSLAFLSLTYLDQVRFAYKFRAEPQSGDLDTAFRLAEKASIADPQNARALQAAMLTNFFRNDIAAALAAGAESYSLNPNDTEVVGEYGLRLAMSGLWESGCDLISKAISKEPGPEGYYEVGMALCAFMRGDFHAAELWSRMSDLDYNPMHRIVLASILGSSGKTELAQQELLQVKAESPRLMTHIREEVSTRLSRPEDQEKFFSGLRAAGAWIGGPEGDRSTIKSR